MFVLGKRKRINGQRKKKRWKRKRGDQKKVDEENLLLAQTPGKLLRT